ncbi:tetratricopeptide repeat protein [Sphingomonas sp. BN140010]|uniref:Tetratricopeptide repeat protein n=1 Tax=Sphingomonas arvum TaxID=2992113 RepID=A0ABT3JD46_9SPHN|nr:tetratricopeptide repeat protein [Sphingomonas sp. BN140010]MCW3797003.1 tetratricopeptide repeat protein [Sphingomonas sp. BN140010]
MGYAWLLLLVVLTAGGLWWLGKLRGAALQLVLAALMLGSAGYALQGRPSLPGVAKGAGRRAPPLPLTEPRQAMLGRFTAAEPWLIMADAFERRGNTEGAVKIIRSALRKHPRDAALYIGLGNALVDHAGMITPASTIAFERARQLAPKHPAPLFFQGLALARSGEPAQALALWRQALALTPPGADYRPIIIGGVQALSVSASAGSPQAAGQR